MPTRLVLTSVLWVLLPNLPVQQEPPKRPPAEKKPALKPLPALKRLGLLVGDWRGIGLPKRSSRSGAWTEKANCVWHFEKGKSPTLVLSSAKSKLLRRLELGFDQARQRYTAQAQLASETQARTFVAPIGKDARKLVFSESVPKSDQKSNQQPDAKEPHQLTLRLLSEKRVLVLVERGRSRPKRVAEIGFTKSGTSIVTRKSKGRECVVTGGAGTIAVTHKGKTYYVCCSGCQQAFKDDPDGVLADYRARVAAEKAKTAEDRNRR